jgi:hypothetical protein
MRAGPPLHDLEARARWHLELGYYPDDGDRELDERDDDDGEYLGHVTCWKCGGEGIDLFCIDDLCHGVGYCIHGDGQRPCPNCHGEGFC